MYKCVLCEHTTASLVSYVNHYKLHKSVHNVKFPCGVPGCYRTFKTYSTFKSHVSSEHSHYSRAVRVSRSVQYIGNVHLECRFSNCQKKCENISDLFAHLRSHIQEGEEINCPFPDCSAKYRVISSFSSHVSRYHRNIDAKVFDNTNTIIGEHAENVNEVVPANPDDVCLENTVNNNDSIIKEDAYLRSVALFYLKLQAKYHIPQSTIQKVTSDLTDIHQVGQ